MRGPFVYRRRTSRQALAALLDMRSAAERRVAVVVYDEEWAAWQQDRERRKKSPWEVLREAVR